MSLEDFERGAGDYAKTRESVKRKRARDQKFQRAAAKRENWSNETLAQEEEKLREEKFRLLAQRGLLREWEEEENEE